MDFEASDEQVMIGDSATLFGTRHYPPSDRLKVLARGQDAVRERWAELAELGWLGLGIPEACGGAGGDGSYVMTLMDSFGRFLMLEPFVSRCVLAPALLGAASTSLASELLSGIANGKVAASLALGEPRAGFSLNWVDARAEAANDGFLISGEKAYAGDGGDAEWFIVPARTSGSSACAAGISLFLVHRNSANLAVRSFRSIDDHHHASLVLDRVQVGKDALVGELGEALPIIETAVDHAITAHLAEAVGSMDALRDITLEYLKTRQQFGKPIGAFQALQHRMVDIDIACEEARSMVYHANAHLNLPAAVRGKAIAAAKVRVGQCGLFVARQAVQLHGGLGVSAELIVSHHLKRQMMLDLAYGNAAYHKERFGSAASLAA